MCECFCICVYVRVFVLVAETNQNLMFYTIITIKPAGNFTFQLDIELTFRFQVNIIIWKLASAFISLLHVSSYFVSTLCVCAFVCICLHLCIVRSLCIVFVLFVCF